MNRIERQPRQSILKRTTTALREYALRMPDGEFLGSEGELIARFGVSRPTLRQATITLIHENVITARRGVGGGYFAARPQSGAVAHVAAVFLKARNTKVSEVIDAMAPIRGELARLAAKSTDDGLRNELGRFLRAEQEAGAAQNFREFLKAERTFGRIFGAMSGNNVITLFLEILYDFSSMLTDNEDIYKDDSELTGEYRRRRNRLAQALMDQDTELAVLAAQRCSMASSVPATMRSPSIDDIEDMLLGIPGE